MAARPKVIPPPNFLERMRAKAIFDDVLLKAFEVVERQDFIDERFYDSAGEDIALPLSCGQTQTAPSAIARMIAALQVSATDRVLEVGTGSGYTTALLAHLALSVTSVDRYRGLYDAAKRRLARPSLGTIAVRHADGLRGYGDEAPYDRILVNGAIESEPVALIDQLTPGGQVVAVLRVSHVSEITRWRRALTGRSIEVGHFGRLDLTLMAQGLSESL